MCFSIEKWHFINREMAFYLAICSTQATGGRDLTLISRDASLTDCLGSQVVSGVLERHGGGA